MISYRVFIFNTQLSAEEPEVELDKLREVVAFLKCVASLSIIKAQPAAQGSSQWESAHMALITLMNEVDVSFLLSGDRTRSAAHIPPSTLGHLTVDQRW